MIEMLAEKYAYSVPDFNLVKYEYVAVPVFKLQLSVTMLDKKQIGLVEEFVLKLIDARLVEVEDLACFLGIDTQIVEASLANLYNDDLVRLSNGSLELTPKGRDCLIEARLVVPREVKYHVIVDGLTAELMPVNQVYTEREIKRLQFYPLTRKVDEPSIETLNFKDISRLLKKEQRETVDDSLNGDLISINAVEKVYTMYKKRSMLVYMHKEHTDRIDIKIFDGFDRLPDYESIILRMEQSGIRQIPTDRRVDRLETVNDELLISKLSPSVVSSANGNKKRVSQEQMKTELLTQLIKQKEEQLEEHGYSDDQKYTATQEIRELKKQLADLREKQESSNKILDTYEHRPLLEKALRESKKLVVIVSPWIKFGAFDAELQRLIADALRRRVRVIIGYGISPEDFGHEGAERILRDLQKTKSGEYLTLVKLGNTHEKVLISDDKYVVITSFNWLSFKGDPNRGFRQETGIYTEDEQTVLSTLENLGQRMSLDIKKHLHLEVGTTSSTQ